MNGQSEIQSRAAYQFLLKLRRRIVLALCTGWLFWSVSAAPDLKAQNTSTSYFFGSPEGSSSHEEDVVEAFSNRDSSGTREEERHAPGDWEEQDLLPIFPELQVLDDISSKRSLERFRQAQDYYRNALTEMENGTYRAEQKKNEPVPESLRYDWEKSEFHDRLNRESLRILARSRSASLGHLIRSMNLMDEIKNPQIADSAEFLEVKSRIYRQYVKIQFQARNLSSCIDILERYMQLRPEHNGESEAHRLLAACYRQQEIIAQRLNNNTSYLFYKKRKNEELLRFARIRYGDSSNEFQSIQTQVDRDMME